MSNRPIRKAIQSLRQRILEHQEKIEREQTQPEPDEGLIVHYHIQEALPDLQKQLGLETE